MNIAVYLEKRNLSFREASLGCLCFLICFLFLFFFAAPDGKMTWCIDYVGYNRKNQPPWKVSLQTLQIVQNHYPERLGRAVNFKPPFLFELFWKAIRPFVDPVTREKLVFLNESDAHRGMENQFDLQYMDAPLYGALPEDGMWDFEACEEKMRAMDEEHKKRLENAAIHVRVEAP